MNCVQTNRSKQIPTQKGQKLTICLVSKIRDCFGVIEVCVLINGKEYTYPISSEFKLRKIESLLYRKKPGKALNLLRDAKITGFNSFAREDRNGIYEGGTGVNKKTGVEGKE